MRQTRFEPTRFSISKIASFFAQAKREIQMKRVF